MPQVTVHIGQHEFAVTCAAGEEEHLHEAARRLDMEVKTLPVQTAQIPEARMLLMAGLTLADKFVALEKRIKEMEQEDNKMADALASLHGQDTAASVPSATSIPAELEVQLDTLVRRSESLEQRLRTLLEDHPAAGPA